MQFVQKGHIAYLPLNKLQSVASSTVEYHAVSYNTFDSFTKFKEKAKEHEREYFSSVVFWCVQMTNAKIILIIISIIIFIN